MKTLPLSAALVAVAATLSLVGCGGGDAPRSEAPAQATPAPGFVRPAGFGSQFYGEIFDPEKKRFFVFGKKDSMEAWKISKEFAFSKTQIGFGPNKETVVFESEKEASQVTERLKKDFDARWNIKRGQ